jgi:ribosomal protein S18 acetylase RimI-like enzyme
MIRALRPADSSWAARQHAELMSNSVFAAFGVRFLECFYSRFARSASSIAFVWEQDGVPLAVISATSNRSRFLRGLVLCHGVPLALYTVAGLLRPSCRHLVGQLRQYPGRIDGEKIEAEMIFITVSPACRGQGVAQQLIDAVLAEYAARSTPQVYVTVESENVGIKRILTTKEFKVIKTFRFADKQNDLLRLDLQVGEMTA